MKMKNRKIYKRVMMVTPEKDFITVYRAVDQRNGRKVIFVRCERQKRKTNDIDIEPVVFQHMGQGKQDTFFEIFNLDLKQLILEFSDEAQYWISKQKEDLKRAKQKITMKVLNRMASRIQRAIRNYLFKRLAQVYLENKKRNPIKRSETEKIVVLKRAMIYTESGSLRAYLTTFHLTIERHLNSRMSPNQTMVQEFQEKYVEQQSIMIKSKALEHLYSQDKVSPFVQKLFYIVDISELITIANRMVDMSRIIKGKRNQQKVDVKPLEEIQAMLLNE